MADITKVAKHAEKFVKLVEDLPNLAPAAQRKVSEALNYVGNLWGKEQSQRLEKAADLGADLSIYDKDALARVVQPDLGHALTVLDPADFQKFAARITQPTLQSVPYRNAAEFNFDFPGKNDTKLQDVLDHYRKIAETDQWNEVPWLGFSMDRVSKMLGMDPSSYTRG